MTAFAIEVCDRWNNWHVATAGNALYVYKTRLAAQQQIDFWSYMETRVGFRKQLVAANKEFGIRYRVVPFNKNRVKETKRKRPLK